MNYYLLKQDLMAPGIAGVSGVPPELEPGDWIRGEKMNAPASRVRIALHAGSGEARGDLIEGLVTLYSTRLKDALTTFGVENVQFFPVDLEPSRDGEESSYWMANVVGRAACVDQTRSTFTRRRLGSGLKLGSFTIDAAQAPKVPIFRLAEDATLVVIEERLKQHLEKAGLAGVLLQRTQDFDGD